MSLIYLFGVRFYAFAVSIAALFLPKAKDWVEGRKQIWNSLPATEGKEVFWFHCASLGEFDQGLPVMNLLRKEKPDAFILVTFFSPSGYNHYTKRQHPVDFACYIPVDTPKNAKRFIAHFRPVCTFFVKYEFWINHISESKKAGSKLYSISTSLRPSQHFFKWYGGFFRNTLYQFDYFFAQNQMTFDLLHSIKIDNVLLTGDTRFDRVIENKKGLQINTQIAQFSADSERVFIAGSTWPKDIELLKPLIHTNYFDKYIIAPHNVGETHVEELIHQLSIPVVRYSKMTTETSIDCNVLVIDSIGQLASAYAQASVAYVGGGFSGSLHNILEPAVFGLPVIFGPKHNRFPEAQAFIDEGIGFSVSTPEELSACMDSVTQNRDSISLKSIHFVEKNQGAAAKIMNLLALS